MDYIRLGLVKRLWLASHDIFIHFSVTCIINLNISCELWYFLSDYTLLLPNTTAATYSRNQHLFKFGLP
jgi:hypothetical protein